MDKEKEIKAYLDGELLPEVRMKYEIAEEMGLLDRVLSDGWKSLSAKETGRIGGLMTKRKKEKLKKWGLKYIMQPEGGNWKFLIGLILILYFKTV